MASIRKRGSSWRAEIYRDGARESSSFPTKQQAAAWAHQREAELGGERLPEHTVKEALRRYAREVSPTHKGEQWEIARLGMMERDELAQVRLPALRKEHVADWKRRRLEAVSGASVRREMTMLMQVLEEARREWGWLHVNPARDVKKPPSPPSRKRRISQDEIDRAVLACGVSELEAETASQRVGLAFLLAIETAMRAGEILGLTWENVRAKSVVLPRTKNGDQREVPLSARAREILAALPRDRPTCFDLDPATRDVLWRRARDAAELGDLHFHDSRAEAIWRLSKKLSVLDLARIIGHRDIKSLMIYYETSAEELADWLQSFTPAGIHDRQGLIHPQPPPSRSTETVQVAVASVAPPPAGRIDIVSWQLRLPLMPRANPHACADAQLSHVFSVPELGESPEASCAMMSKLAALPDRSH